jgi:hypothetical protein
MRTVNQLQSVSGVLLRATAAVVVRSQNTSAPRGAEQTSITSCPRFNAMDAPLLYGINRARVEVDVLTLQPKESVRQ